MAKRTKKQDSVYQLKITLQRTRPSIWRKVLIDPNLQLGALHQIIQTAMGWDNSHLHHFRKDKMFFSSEKPDFADNLTKSVYKRYDGVKVSHLLKKEKDKIEYEYDFGDSWIHIITLEKILPYDDTVEYPVCIGGKRQCPPEDCGGLGGFYYMLEVLKDPNHEDYEDFMDWLGEDFDPEFVDIEEINKLLKEDDYSSNRFF